MFSLIYRKPFIAISPCTGDSRIKDVLEETGLTNNLVFNNNEEPNIITTNPYTENVERKIKSFIDTSKNFLDTAIAQVNK